MIRRIVIMQFHVETDICVILVCTCTTARNQSPFESFQDLQGPSRIFRDCWEASLTFGDFQGTIGDLGDSSENSWGHLENFKEALGRTLGGHRGTIHNLRGTSRILRGPPRNLRVPSGKRQEHLRPSWDPSSNQRGTIRTCHWTPNSYFDTNATTQALIWANLHCLTTLSQ